MANVGGFEIVTPQELRDQVNAQVQKMRSSGNPALMQAANSQQVINSLFGSPQIRKAEAENAALAEAMNSVTRESDEDEVDFQIRQAAAVRQGLADLNPQVAMQANERILKLQVQKAEMGRLKVDTESKQQALDEAIWTLGQAKTPVIMEVTDDGQIIPRKWLEAGADPSTIEGALTAMQAQFPEKKFDVGDGQQALEAEGLDLVASLTGKGHNKKFTDALVTDLLSGARVARGFNQVSTRLMNDFGALSTFSAAEAATIGGIQGVDDIITNYGDFLKQNEDVKNGTFSAQEIAAAGMARAQGLINEGDLTEIGRARGVSRAVAQGLILNLAYSLARSLDSGGRLSDQDVKMATQMLTGNGDPNAIAQLFEERLRETTASLEVALKMADSNQLGVAGSTAADAYRRDSESALTTLQDLNEKLMLTGENVPSAAEVSVQTPRRDVNTPVAGSPEEAAERARLIEEINKRRGG